MYTIRPISLEVVRLKRNEVIGAHPSSPKEPLTETAYREIRQSITAGEFEPGSHLVEASLAKTLALSRTSVRSALHRLVGEGRLVRRPMAGVFVPASAANDEELRELLDCRAVLEATIARDAALKATAEHRTRLESILALEAEAVSAGRSSVEFETDFRRVLAEIADNKWMSRLLSEVLSQLDRVGDVVEFSSNILDMHRSIFIAIDTMDGGAAWRAVIAHVERVKESALTSDDEHLDY